MTYDQSVIAYETALVNLNLICACDKFYIHSHIEGAARMSNAVMAHYASIVCRAEETMKALAHDFNTRREG